MEQRTYMTHQKKELLSFLQQNADRHFTVEQIVEGMGGGKAGKSTVYRQIAKLAAEGVVRRFETPDSTSFVYQFAGETNSCDCHFHLKCMKCGRLIHMECAQLSAVQRHIADEHDFLLGSHRAVLYGECTDCGEKE
ncbi:MAG: transcriptional repressor [Clostridia bacterium]|nr:transcriptional repressor [Clostridia bacterium]